MHNSAKQNKGRMMYDISCLIICGITAIFLVMAILYSFGIDINWHGPWTAILLAVGGTLTGIGGFTGKPMKNWAKNIGKWAMHFGLVIMLIGFAVFAAAGETINANVPVGSDTYYANIQRENGEVCELGFNFRITDFNIDYHEDGTDKMYRAGIEFADAVSLRVDSDELSVNGTIVKNGWRIYLMSYSGDTVNLMFRRDPGEIWVKTGIWMTVAGTVLSLLVANMLPVKKEDDK
ncbi:MAG: cytochrome c biogenesis protein ResB [Clostridia bacterium]|nr:cytochrome c biogenesis protein ResB [Clostridia bacterium]